MPLDNTPSTRGTQPGQDGSSAGEDDFGLFPSEFATQAFTLPGADGRLAPFSFQGRRYFIQPYDTPARRVLLRFGRQCEKTLEENTPVVTEHGELVPIKDVEVGSRVATMVADGAHLGSGRVVAKTARYRKRCVRVTTQLGHVADMGYTHPVRQWERWTIADNLRPGDRVATVRRLPHPAGEAMDPQHVAFVGYVLGYGSLLQTLGFTQDVDSDALRHFRQICADQGWPYREYPKAGSNSVDIRFNKSSGAYALVSSLGLLGLSPQSKHIPPRLMRLPRAQTVELLQAMWACDGHVKKKGRSQYEIVYCTISPVMARQVQALLWKLGVPSRLRVQVPAVYRGTEKKAYLLHVRTREGIEQFLTQLRVPGKEAAIPDVDANDNRDTYPMEATLDLKRRRRSTTYQSWRAAQDDGRYNGYKYPMSRRKFSAAVEYLQRKGVPVADLAPHVDTDIIWDTVVSVDDLGERWCYDIEVEDTHSFVAAGVVTHNSTYLGNRVLTHMFMRDYFANLFVTPRQQQAEVFSKARLRMPISTSDVLRTRMAGVLGRDFSDNVLYKLFNNGSSVTLRYAFLNADSSRGIMGDHLVLDEIQDILPDVVPVLEETLSHSPHKLMTYAGTPKSTDNTIEYYWERFSTQYELVIPCDACGIGGVHWNVVDYQHIGKTGLICDRCGKRITPDHPRTQWASMRSPEWLRNPPASVGIPFEGYRIPQPVVSWLSWPEILDKKARYPIGQFKNEVLGLPHDAGDKLIRRQALVDSSDPNLRMADAHKYLNRGPIFMGIDWSGGGETMTSYTVVSIGAYFGDFFQFMYFRRFDGPEAEYEVLMPEINRLIHVYNVHLVGTDYGGGLDRNDYLIRRHGVHKILRYQYVGTKKLYYDRSLARYMVNRNEALFAFGNAVNRMGVFKFPNWEDWETPFGEDMQAAHVEYNQSARTLTVTRNPGRPDDTLHSGCYCFLASMVVHPRPDILQPDKDRE